MNNKFIILLYINLIVSIITLLCIPINLVIWKDNIAFQNQVISYESQAHDERLNVIKMINSYEPMRIESKKNVEFGMLNSQRIASLEETVYKANTTEIAELRILLNNMINKYSQLTNTIK